MKYAVLVGDGMADWPVKELKGKTPLEVSNKPNMDWICQNGAGGKAITVPKGMEPGSDVANMSILGYDPKKYYFGRGPFEAASYGVELKEDEVAFRCNIVTVRNGRMVDYSAGHIKTEESRKIINSLNKKFGAKGIKFYTGVSYRNLMVIKEDMVPKGLRCTPPHDIMGKKIDKYLPKGEIRSIMEDTNYSIWLWGYGKKPKIPLFKDRFGVKAGMISAVGLLKGIAKCIGMEVINVPGATGYYDTDYSAKASYAINALNRLDLIFVHVEAPDEAGHNGDLKEKIRAIENFDKKVVGPILEYLRSIDEYRILVLPDHATPLEIRTHVGEPVPFAMCGGEIHVDNIQSFTEKDVEKGSMINVRGDKLMELLCLQ